MEERKVVETLLIKRSVEVTTEDIDDILCGSLRVAAATGATKLRSLGDI